MANKRKEEKRYIMRATQINDAKWRIKILHRQKFIREQNVFISDCRRKIPGNARVDGAACRVAGWLLRISIGPGQSQRLFKSSAGGTPLRESPTRPLVPLSSVPSFPASSPSLPPTHAAHSPPPREYFSRLSSVESFRRS